MGDSSFITIHTIFQLMKKWRGGHSRSQTSAPEHKRCLIVCGELLSTLWEASHAFPTLQTLQTWPSFRNWMQGCNPVRVGLVGSLADIDFILRSHGSENSTPATTTMHIAALMSAAYSKLLISASNGMARGGGARRQYRCLLCVSIATRGYTLTDDVIAYSMACDPLQLGLYAVN
ncbi:hypothetical protein J6590_016248 [Homalodisca vitripennis]|nr:hypothetical protein J6590_016248 [Homalodisca vitripennis]